MVSERAMQRAAEAFVRLEDGFLYFAPGEAGAMSPHFLRAVADELDKRNADWQKMFDSYFSDPLSAK
jgi:hypothetical protein